MITPEAIRALIAEWREPPWCAQPMITVANWQGRQQCADDLEALLMEAPEKPSQEPEDTPKGSG